MTRRLQRRRCAVCGDWIFLARGAGFGELWLHERDQLTAPHAPHAAHPAEENSR